MPTPLNKAVQTEFQVKPKWYGGYVVIMRDHLASGPTKWETLAWFPTPNYANFFAYALAQSLGTFDQQAFEKQVTDDQQKPARQHQS